MCNFVYSLDRYLCLRAYILITPESCWVETINKENNRTQSKKNRRGKCCNLVDIIDSPRWVCLYLFEPKRLNNSVRRHPTQHVLPTSTWSRDLGDSIAESSVLPSDSQSCDPEFEHRQITLLLKSEDEHYGGYNSHQNTDLNLNVSIKVQAKCNFVICQMYIFLPTLVSMSRLGWKIRQKVLKTWQKKMFKRCSNFLKSTWNFEVMLESCSQFLIISYQMFINILTLFFNPRFSNRWPNRRWNTNAFFSRSTVPTVKRTIKNCTFSWQQLGDKVKLFKFMITELLGSLKTFRRQNIGKV